MNILYLLTDQMRFDALSCNGAPVCRTPEIDRLAKHGTNFTSAYSVNALCTPARASIVTGLYPHMHGQLSNMGNFNGVFDRQVLRWKGYSHYLKMGGYQTGYIGKWHLPEEGNKEVWSFDAWDTDRDYDKYLKRKGLIMIWESVRSSIWNGAKMRLSAARLFSVRRIIMMAGWLQEPAVCWKILPEEKSLL